MKLTRAKLIGATLGVLAIAAVAFALRPKPLVVETSTIARRNLEATVDADGRTRVRERYVVVAPVAGRLARITRVEGALVRAGDIVARLTPLPLDSQAVTQAQARVDGANALVLEASAQVRVANANLDQRRRELSRAKRLAQVGGVAPRVVEESELAELQAKESVRAAEERARAAEADARQARAALLGREANRPATVLVRAPAGGRVLRVPERSERIVAAGTPLLELGDPASLEVVVDVLSSDGATIHPGDRVRLAEWGGGDNGEHMNPLAGRVREIEPAGFTKVSALGVEEQRVNVIVDVDTIPPGVGDGFRVDASIIVWSAPNVIVVPRSALLQASGTSGGWSAFVVKAGRVEARSVRIGHVGGTAAEVLVGVDEGDEVVLFPSDQVKAGIRVAPRKT
ncbi:MAG TPA: HlyD family efflux transporter periplasmic adaptor subunit [Gemmatimonadaceae bacterium]|jgi:HlyD family secretion protein